ncbi:uncharacterized protein LOC135129511 [Zophobas morio]|uniref:uncharacterized protein LOC135129511 n=1 Tax=Zophobas morio TaxID=2755281 RepID=UPI003082EDB1
MDPSPLSTEVQYDPSFAMQANDMNTDMLSTEYTDVETDSFATSAYRQPRIITGIFSAGGIVVLMLLERVFYWFKTLLGFPIRVIKAILSAPFRIIYTIFNFPLFLLNLPVTIVTKIMQTIRFILSPITRTLRLVAKITRFLLGYPVKVFNTEYIFWSLYGF